jgi:hypothetical protein
VVLTTELVFVPGVGFRAASGRALATPVTAERGEWSVTIERLLVAPERTELRYALTGPIEGDVSAITRPPKQPAWFQDPVAVRLPDGSTLEMTPEGGWGGSEFSVSPPLRQQSIRRTVTFKSPLTETERLDVLLGGAPGAWTIPVELTTNTTFGIPARRVDSTDSHHGVAIDASAIAVGESLTAIDVRTTLAPTQHPRFMRSLGTKQWDRGDESQLILSDDTGVELGEFARQGDSVTRGSELHEILVFPPLGSNAKTAVLTIPEIRVAETTGTPVTLAVPSETDIDLGGDRVHARVTRGRGRRGTVVRVALDDGGWHEGRRVLYAESVCTNGVLRGIGWERRHPGRPRICGCTR